MALELEDQRSEETESLPEGLLPSLTVKQLSELIGVKLHDCYPLLESGLIPGGYRIGKRWRVRQDTVLAWMDAGGSRGGEG